jgi:Lysine methyltransferase
MYRYDERGFGHTGTPKTNSFGIDCCLLHDLMAQETKPNWINSTEIDAIETHLHDDPILLVVNLENDNEDGCCFHPSQPPPLRSQRQASRKSLKVRSSECLVLPNGRHYYSALALRQRLALWTGRDINTDYDVVSSRNEHVIGLPSGSNSNNNDNDNDNILDLLGSRLQLRVKHRPVTSTSVVLRIQGRHFHFDGTLTVADTTLRFVESPSRPNQGTSYNVWDGSLLMARYLELNPQTIRGHSVLELGSGCGAAGLSAAALGACFVTLTDLPGQVLEHVQANIDHNDVALTECRVEARACDWRDPPMELVSVRKYNVILIADCVWVEELVDPLFDVLELMTRPASDPPRKVEPGSEETGKEEATESTVMMYDEEVDENTMRIQEIGKYTRDERSSNNIDESTHDKFERGFLERSDAMAYSMPSVDFEEFASFYDDEITTTRVIISYQRRGKSTHEQFIGRLHDLFSEIEIVAIPGQPEIFTIYSCQR